MYPSESLKKSRDPLQEKPICTYEHNFTQDFRLPESHAQLRIPVLTDSSEQIDCFNKHTPSLTISEAITLIFLSKKNTVSTSLIRTADLRVARDQRYYLV